MHYFQNRQDILVSLAALLAYWPLALAALGILAVIAVIVWAAREVYFGLNRELTALEYLTREREKLAARARHTHVYEISTPPMRLATTNAYLSRCACGKWGHVGGGRAMVSQYQSLIADFQRRNVAIQ